jgi:hypothetical protein
MMVGIVVIAGKMTGLVGDWLLNLLIHTSARSHSFHRTTFSSKPTIVPAYATLLDRDVSPARRARGMLSEAQRAQGSWTRAQRAQR